MKLYNAFEKIWYIFKGINIAAPALSLVFGIILAIMGRLNFINGVFAIIVFPFVTLGMVSLDLDLGEWSECSDRFEEFKHHKFTTILYWICSVILVVTVIVAFAKGLNSELSQWKRFWVMAWEYIKGCLLFYISYLVKYGVKEDVDAKAASDIRSIARRFRK